MSTLKNRFHQTFDVVCNGTLNDYYFLSVGLGLWSGNFSVLADVELVVGVKDNTMILSSVLDFFSPHVLNIQD